MTINLASKGGGVLPPIDIINGSSDTGSPGKSLARFSNSAKLLSSGALTADVFSTVLSVTGSGVLECLGVAAEDTTSRSVGCRLTIDGTVVFNAISSVGTVSNRGVLVAGATDASSGLSYTMMPFNESMLVEVISSLTETNKVETYITYRLT